MVILSYISSYRFLFILVAMWEKTFWTALQYMLYLGNVKTSPFPSNHNLPFGIIYMVELLPYCININKYVILVLLVVGGVIGLLRRSKILCILKLVMYEVDLWADLQSILYLRTVKVATFYVFLSFPWKLIYLLELYTDYSHINIGVNYGLSQGGRGGGV